MGITILVQFIRPYPDERTVKPTPIPRCMFLSCRLRRSTIVANARMLCTKVPRKPYTFVENPRYMHEDMFASEKATLHTLHNWIELSAGK
jgi:hypothetical protein